MITMDPNETLRVLREAVAYWQDMPSNASDAWRREVADAMAEHAEALDAWLSRGGFLPHAWRQTLPQTIHNMTPDELSDVRDEHTYGKRDREVPSPPLNGCRWCGVPPEDHPESGRHKYTEPSADQKRRWYRPGRDGTDAPE